MAIYIDDLVQNGKKEVCASLGLDYHSIPTTRRKVLELRTRVIDDKGTKRSMKSLGGKPEYVVFCPHLGREVKVRYARMQRKDKDGTPSYPDPKTLFLLPAEDGSVLINDDLEFIFWYLHPMCAHSPFFKKGSESAFEFQDHDAKATAEVEREEAYINAMSIIVGMSAWSDTELKHLAKGMNVVGVDDMTPAVVKQNLKNLAKRDPILFYNRANSREIVFSGKVQEAIDRKVLHTQTVNGMTRWYLKDKEILPLAYGQDALTELKKHLADKWYLYSDDIERELSGVSVKTALESPQNDAAFEKLPKVPTLEMPASMTPEQVELLKKIRAATWLEEKMQKIDTYDLSDPDLHPGKKASYEKYKDYYHAWKAEKEALAAEEAAQ